MCNKRRGVRRHSVAIRVATNVPNIPRLSAGDMVQKMSYVALMDAIREEFYWDYVPITVGWCNLSMERMHQQGRLGKTGWNVLDAS